jgi:hypothetical protein
MLFQQGIPTSFTFTIGWVDVFILLLLVFAFFRGRRAFTPVLIFVIFLYLIRLFPQQIIQFVQTINTLNGPLAFVTISR